MTTTIELAEQAGIEFQENTGITGKTRTATTGSQPIEKLEAFRALIVAERDRELIGMADFESTYAVALRDSKPGTIKNIAQLCYTAARLQGAEGERKKWQDNLHANVEYCPTCCEGKLASPDMTRDEVIFQCGKTSGRLQGAQRIAELEQQLAEKREPLMTAIETVIGCFRAAEVEGLTQVLAETQDERLKDLVERRLMHALYAANNIGGKHD